MTAASSRKRTLLGLGAVVLLIAAFLPGCASLLPSAMHAVDPDAIYRIRGPRRTLYLTLDDGPSPATPEILAILAKHGVPATFFVIADHIEPERMRAIVAGGHALGHHMKSTEKLARMSEDRFEAEFREADRRIGEYGRIVAFRPPGGSIGREQANFVRQAGYPIVAGTIYPLDHLLKNETGIEWLARGLIVDGGIIILHDTADRGPRTARVLDRLLPELRKQGYVFAALPGNAPPPSDPPAASRSQ